MQDRQEDTAKDSGPPPLPPTLPPPLPPPLTSKSASQSPAPRRKREQIVWTVLFILVAAGVLAYSSGLHVRAAKWYKGWRLSKQLQEPLLECRKLTAECDKAAKDFVSYADRVASDFSLQKDVADVLAPLGPAGEGPGLVKSDAIAQATASMSGRYDKAVAELDSAWKEPSDALSRAQAAQQTLKSEVAEGKAYAESAVTVELAGNCEQFGADLTRYNDEMQSARDRARQKIDSEREPLQKELARFQTAFQAQQAYFEANFVKAVDLMQDFPQDTYAGGHQRQFIAAIDSVAPFAGPEGQPRVSAPQEESPAGRQPEVMAPIPGAGPVAPAPEIQRGRRRGPSGASRAAAPVAPAPEIEKPVAVRRGVRAERPALPSAEDPGARAADRSVQPPEEEQAPLAATPPGEQSGEGKVITVWAGAIVVNLGSMNGAGLGTALVAELSQNPIKDPAKPERVLGFDEMQIRVKKADKRLSICIPSEKTKSLPSEGDSVHITSRQ